MTNILRIITILLFIIWSLVSISNADTVSDPNNRSTSVSTSEFANNYSNETGFRVNPSIELNQTQKVIRYSEDGIVELYINNPKLNGASVITKVRILTPPEIIVNSDLFLSERSLSDNRSGNCYIDYYTVIPGSSQFIRIPIEAEKVGNYNVSFNVIYYPEGHNEKFQTSTVTYQFLAEEISHNLSDNSTEYTETWQSPPDEPSYSEVPNIFDYRKSQEPAIIYHIEPEKDNKLNIIPVISILLSVISLLFGSGIWYKMFKKIDE